MTWVQPWIITVCQWLGVTDAVSIEIASGVFVGGVLLYAIYLCATVVVGMFAGAISGASQKTS